jgi:RNA polymerase sigma-70 factor (ECF subfamily)
MAGLWADGPAHGVSDREKRWQSYVAGIAAGNPECLHHLYDESAPSLLGLALRMIKNKADAEEIILDVFERVWRTANTFDPARGSAWRWLTVMVRSRTMDRLRTPAWRFQREHLLPLVEEWEIVSHDPLPDSATIQNQERNLVRSAIELLPGDQRLALELAYFSGLTHVEIASELAPDFSRAQWFGRGEHRGIETKIKSNG